VLQQCHSLEKLKGNTSVLQWLQGAWMAFGIIAVENENHNAAVLTVFHASVEFASYSACNLAIKSFNSSRLTVTSPLPNQFRVMSFQELGGDLQNISAYCRTNTPQSQWLSWSGACIDEDKQYRNHTFTECTGVDKKFLANCPIFFAFHSLCKNLEELRCSFEN
jgi:hypothetical protein